MIKIKNILSENMRRFGTKNLNEQADIRQDSLMNTVAKDLENGTISIPGFIWDSYLSPTNKPKFGFKLKSNPESRFTMYLIFKMTPAGQKPWVAEINNEHSKAINGTWEYDANSKTIKLLDQTGVDVTNTLENKYLKKS